MKSYNKLNLIYPLLIILVTAFILTFLLSIPEPSSDYKIKSQDKVTSSSDLHKDPVQNEISARNPKEKSQQDITLSELERMVEMYAYDEALSLIENHPEKDSVLMLNLKSQIESAKNSCILKDPLETTHIFFHSLIYDTSKAFDGDYKMDGYNQFMNTAFEFDKILASLYERDYVLISIHDLASLITDEQGNEKMIPGEIYLPENKKMLILSVDDVNYYEYMVQDGFAHKMVLDQNGQITCSMLNNSGLPVLGDFDIVPILDKFVEKHPDFSYKGAKGILALTGYQGILGYRTDETNQADNPNFENDLLEAAKVAEALKNTGWEFASHSWGHINSDASDLKDFKQDADRWEKNVLPLIGQTDIMIYPFGIDIEDGFTDYSYDNPRFSYLKQKGFNYFCTVDGSKVYSTIIKDDYLRQGRRNLDGYRLYYNPELVDDLMDVQDVFDEARPLPVPPL